MNRYTPSPQYAIVFDVNVLIDAVNQTSRHHDAAVRALSSTKDQPVYFSDHMLKTTAHELIRLGAEPAAVQEYLEFITVPEDEFDVQARTFDHIDFHDYDIRDRYGNPDKEDATIVSLMDAAEEHARMPALLVTTDGGLQEWCSIHRRDVTFPRSLPRVLAQHEDDYQASNFEYMSRRMFPQGKFASKLDSTPQIKDSARDVVAGVRDQRRNSPVLTSSVNQRGNGPRPGQYRPSIDIASPNEPDQSQLS